MAPMKWVRRTVLGGVVLLLLAAGALYLWSSMLLDRTYPAEERRLLLSSRPDVIARGERLAQVFGCFHGCHGADMEGMVFVESWYAGRIVAPNLTRAMDTFSVAELEAIIRQGVRPDGTSIFGMPASAYASMTDRDLAAILGFIGSYPGQSLDLGRSRYGPLARWLLIRGEIRAEAGLVEGGPRAAGVEKDPLRHGRYLATNACAECHGLELDGGNQFAPPLDVARSYSLEDFSRLLRTGVGAGDLDLGLMSQVARFRFSRLTDAEIEALYRYLATR
jgi:mono/diheme cytochrome c family protein